MRHETPETFLKEFTFTYAHDKSIKAVAQKILDGGGGGQPDLDFQNLSEAEGGRCPLSTDLHKLF
jgi:hypothetical protein